jgi:TetR/AcrR family transcriptional regulator, regulator of mycofactocin system
MPVHQPAWVARTAQTRADIITSALALFGDGGFDATTVEQIVDAAGVGRRTFFRYFPSKEAVLFSEFTARQALVVERLRAKPDDEPPLESLVAVLRSISDEPIDTERAEAVRRIVAASPSLRDRPQRIFVDEFARDLTHVLSQRTGANASTVALRALVISALGCIEAATMAHLRNPRLSTHALFDEALDACRSSWSALP